MSPFNTVESIPHECGGWDCVSPPKEEEKPKRRTVKKSILKNRRRSKAKAVAIAKEDANGNQCNFHFQEMQEVMLEDIIEPLAEDAAIVYSALQNIWMMELKSSKEVDAISHDKTISSKSTRTIDTTSDDKSVSLPTTGDDKSVSLPLKYQKITLSKGLSTTSKEATKSAVKRRSDSNKQKNDKQATDASAKSKIVSSSRKLERKVSSRTMIVGLK